LSARAAPFTGCGFRGRRKGLAISRRYPERPVVGVGALIFDQQGRILLVQRGGEPLKGWWSLPGGVLETGETLADGVRREVREETGLEVEPATMIDVFERIMRDAEGRPEYHYVLIDYICRVTGGTPEAADDCAGIVWASRDDLRNLRITEGTVGVIEKAYNLAAA
jgi:mutator protein MutT